MSDPDPGERARRAGGISVVVATRDRPEALARCLRTLAAGRRVPDEVVVVDQSADGRTRAVTEHAASSVPIVYGREARPGLGAAQNRGFALASGRVIAVTDDDCVPDPGWLETIERTLGSAGDLAALTGRVLPLDPAAGDRRHAVASRTSRAARDFHGRVAPWEVGSGNNFAASREWLERIGGCDERLGPGAPAKGAVDMDLFYRLLRAGARIRYEPGCLVLHERQSRGGRLARRFPYGYGMGACCVFLLLDGDRHAPRLLAGWLRMRAGRLARALARGRLVRAWEETLVLAGTGVGLVHPVRSRASGRRRRAGADPRV